MNSAKKIKGVLKSAKQEIENNDPLWSTQNQQLQSQAEANSRLRQQISKESSTDFAVQARIKDNIASLKDKAVIIAQNLECQKRKNIQLQAIIRHMTQARSQQKTLEATYRDDINFESVDNLFRKIKKFQYDLEQMFSKYNDITSKNKERKGQIDVYRTQRVIDSGIFLKIQKEIIQSENDYKKLLIEKTRFEQEYSSSLQNYKKIKADIEKEQEISLSKRENHDRHDRQDRDQQQFFVNMPQIEHAVKFTQISNNQPKRKSFVGSRKNLSIFESKKEQHQQEVQYTVKKIFVDTGLNSSQKIIDYLNNIEKMNEDLFLEVNRGTDKICALNQEINELRQKKEKKTIKYYEKDPEPTKNQIRVRQMQEIQQEANKVDASTQKIMNVLDSFLVKIDQMQKTNQIRQTCKAASVDLDKENVLEDLPQLFSKLEIQLSPILNNYYEFKKQLEDPSTQNARESIEKESIQDLISRVIRIEQSQKIMVKEDFKREYEKILKSESGSKGRNGKKKTTFVKKH